MSDSKKKKLQKILALADPNSVVRQGEVDRLNPIFDPDPNSVVREGEGRLTEKELERLKALFRSRADPDSVVREGE